MEKKISKEIQTENMMRFKVTKSNDLIRLTRYSMPTNEYKMLCYVMMQIEPEDTDFQPYSIDIGNFCEICGIKPKGAYASLKKAIKSLADRSFWILDEETGKERLLRWITSVELEKGKGKMTVTVNPELKPYLLEQKKDFTTYAFSNVALNDSQYSARLYELLLCRLFKYKGALDVGEAKVINYGVEELKTRFDAENYTVYKDFKRRCLLPAVSDINQYSDIEVTFKEVLKGNKAVSINFYVKRTHAPIFVNERDLKLLGRKYDKKE